MKSSQPFFNIITMAGTGAFSLFTSKIKPRGAFGPCLVCCRQDYFAVGGHGRARAQLLESMGLADAFREAGLPVSCYGGKGAVSFQMYPAGFRSMIDGFSRGFGEGAKAISIPMLVLLVAWVTGGMSVTRHLIQSTFSHTDGSLFVWAGLLCGLFGPGLLDAAPHWKFRISPVHSLPLAVTLFCDRFFSVPVAQNGHWKNLLERPADKMRIIHLPILWTVALDIGVWFVIHMGVVLCMVRIPQNWFHPDSRLYRERPWEKGGASIRKGVSNQTLEVPVARRSEMDEGQRIP